MPINKETGKFTRISDEKRRELKRKLLRHTRIELEIAREKGFGVNFTSYMPVEEYEPQLVEEELQQACAELNVLNNIIHGLHPEEMMTDELKEQVDILHSLIRPRAWLQQQMSNYNAKSLEELKGRLS